MIRPKKKSLKTVINFDNGRYEARLGVVHWKDACVYIKTGGQLNQAVDCMSVGYIVVIDKILIVIHNFSDGKPDDYITIPKDWMTKIIYLEERLW